MANELILLGAGAAGSGVAPPSPVSDVTRVQTGPDSVRVEWNTGAANPAHTVKAEYKLNSDPFVSLGEVGLVSDGEFVYSHALGNFELNDVLTLRVIVTNGGSDSSPADSTPLTLCVPEFEASALTTEVGGAAIEFTDLSSGDAESTVLEGRIEPAEWEDLGMEGGFATWLPSEAGVYDVRLRKTAVGGEAIDLTELKEMYIEVTGGG